MKLPCRSLAVAIPMGFCGAAGYGALACGGVLAAASEAAVLASGLCAYAAQAVARGVVTLGCLAHARECSGAHRAEAHPTRSVSPGGRRAEAKEMPCPTDLGFQLETREAAGNTDDDPPHGLERERHPRTLA